MTDLKIIRSSYKNALSTFIKSKQTINTIEKLIYNTAQQQFNDPESVNNFEEVSDFYTHIMYQIIGDLLQKTDPAVIITYLQSNTILWKHRMFQTITSIINEQDDFIMNPFEVEEGVTECKKCNSKRVFTYSKQCRSSDEPMSTFAECVKCGAKWKYSG